MPTYFGPVTFTLLAGAKPRTVEVIVEQTQKQPGEIWLVARVPYGRIREVTIDGKRWTDIDAEREAIRLPRGQGQLQVRIRY